MKNHYTSIWDLDGTLSDCRHRIHLVKEKKYDQFHERCIMDPPRMAEVHLFRAMSQPGHLSVILTGRPENYLDDTWGWLRQYSIIPDMLIMRERGSSEPSIDFKRRNVLKLREGGHVILFAVEDRPHLVQMFLDLGIPTLQSH